jgi:hypothetical protein
LLGAKANNGIVPCWKSIMLGLVSRILMGVDFQIFLHIAKSFLHRKLAISNAAT